MNIANTGLQAAMIEKRINDGETINAFDCALLLNWYRALVTYLDLNGQPAEALVFARKLQGLQLRYHEAVEKAMA